MISPTSHCQDPTPDPNTALLATLNPSLDSLLDGGQGPQAQGTTSPNPDPAVGWPTLTQLGEKAQEALTQRSLLLRVGHIYRAKTAPTQVERILDVSHLNMGDRSLVVVVSRKLAPPQVEGPNEVGWQEEGPILLTPLEVWMLSRELVG